MQYPWLEKMASVGDIRPEAKARIYADCSQLLKTALDERTKYEQAAVKTLSGAAELGANFYVNHLWDRFLGHRRMQKNLSGIRDSRAFVLKDPAFSEHLEKADARFTELARVAPTLAGDKNKARDLVGKALHTGFSNDDMNHLAIMQAVYTSHDPSYTSRITEKQEKKASAERLGEMYADVLALVKEAGLFDSITRGVQRGGVAAAEGIAQAAGGMRPATAMQVLKNVALVSSIPLLAGVGQGLIQEYRTSRSSKEMATRLRESYNEAMRLAKHDSTDDTKGVALNDNPTEAYRAFQTLCHFAPHVAIHPDSARTFMTRMVGQGQFLELPDAKQMTEIEKNLSGAGKQSPFFQGFASGAQALGLGEGIRSTVKDTTEPFRERARAAVSRDLGMKSSAGKRS